MSAPTPIDTTAAALRCPACGNQGERGEIRYLVDGSARTGVVALTAGVMALAGPVPSSAHGARPQLECWALLSTSGQKVCRRQWDLPVGIHGIIWRPRS